MNASIFSMFSCRGNRRGVGNKVLALSGTFWYIFPPYAGIAQLVERNLAKVDVAGSSPVSRSVSFPDEGKGHLATGCQAIWLSDTSSMNLPRCHNSHQATGFFLFTT
jgi:hypothetical protein